MAYEFEEVSGRRGRAAGAVPAAVRLGFEPDAWQERVLKSGARRGILNCTRQWGRSTVTAVKAVEQSPSARQSGEFLRKTAGLARRLGVKRKGDGDNELSLQFPNGSRIVGLPGKEGTIRGFSAVSCAGWAGCSFLVFSTASITSFWHAWTRTPAALCRERCSCQGRSKRKPSGRSKRGPAGAAGSAGECRAAST